MIGAKVIAESNARASYIDEYPRHQLSGSVIPEIFNVDWVRAKENPIIDTLQQLMNNKVDVEDAVSGA